MTIALPAETWGTIPSATTVGKAVCCKNSWQPDL
jgi:hypothetical protein